METNPVIIYATLAVGVLIVFAQAVPKILGPIGTAMQGWAQGRREARIEARSADMIDVQRQVEYLTEARKSDRAEHEAERAKDATEKASLQHEFSEHRRLWAQRESRWRAEWHAHRQWDYRAQEALLGRNPPFDISPAFMTPDPPEENP